MPFKKGGILSELNSLQQFQLLNQENEFSVQIISNEYVLDANDIFADVINIPSKSTYKGLIVSLNKSIFPNSLLLLEPFIPLTNNELEEIAEQYMELVPEIDYVEIDQALELATIYITEDMNVYFGNNEHINKAEKTVKVAVIDSGIYNNHDIFDNIEIVEGWNAISNNRDTFDDVGHGTHIAGIIASLSSNVSFFPYKVVNKEGGRLSYVLKALNKAIDDEVDIINVSFGFSSDSYALENIINDINNEGIIVVAAAGNKNSDTPFYPASYDTTIAVGSIDLSGNKLPKSNYGDWVDVATNGNNIRSSIPFNKYRHMTGTSQSTAFVTAKLINFVRTSKGDSLFFDKESMKEFIVQYENFIWGKNL